jgi:hypothetical protein
MAGPEYHKVETKFFAKDDLYAQGLDYFKVNFCYCYGSHVIYFIFIRYNMLYINNLRI